MKRIRLEIVGVPLAKQSFRFGKPIRNKRGKLYTPKYQRADIKQKKEEIKKQIRMQLLSTFIPFSNYIVIERLEFCFQPPKHISKKVAEMIAASETNPELYVMKTTKPDLDNLEKNLWDAMNKLVYTDDGLICYKKQIIKRFSFNPRIIVELSGE